MKKILLIAVAAFVSASAFAQGTINFGTFIGPGNPGNTTVRLADGSPAAVGGTIMAALYFAPAGVTDPSAFMQVGASAGIAPLPGIVFGGTRTAPVTPPGSPANFQIRVWDSAFGATYEDAVGAGSEFGLSSIVELATGDPTTSPPGAPANLAAALAAANGGMGATIELVPEPSVFALGALGAGALLLLRRRK